MPTLNWIGKDKIVTHHQEVPVHELVHQYGFSESGKQDASTNSGNMIIHGDNLVALKSLMPEYEGKIDCVYIDPPYNTGEEKWVYNDNVKDPRINEWLGKVVGKEGEDLTRHDKWVNMMVPRLQLIKKLIDNNGVICISIGFHELNNLVQICNEIFPHKQVVVVTVQTSGGKPKEGFNYVQEYLVFIVPRRYSPNVSRDAMNEYSSAYHAMTLAGFNQVSRPNQVYPIYVDKETGEVKEIGKSLQELIDNGEYIGKKKDFKFDYSAPKGQVALWPITDKGDSCAWRLSPDSFKINWDKGFVKISPKSTKKDSKNIFSVQYLAEGIIKKIEQGEIETYKISDDIRIPTLEVLDFTTGGVNIPTIWNNKDYYTANGSSEITEIFGEKGVFPYPKPTSLIKDILQRISKKDSIILDCFAGSGTTANAVLQLNKEDNGTRNYICVEMMDYADTITTERVKRVIQGYPFVGKKKYLMYSKKLTAANLNKFSDYYSEALKVVEDNKELFSKISKPTIKDNSIIVEAENEFLERMPGLGGEFDFYEIGEPLYIDGLLNPNVSEDSLRKYVFYTETKKPLIKDRKSDEPYFLDTYNDTAYYFYYDKGKETVLKESSLSNIITSKKDVSTYILYADSCLLSEEKLKRLGIKFKKIPRDIQKY